MAISALVIGGFILLVLVIVWGVLLVVAIGNRSTGGIIALTVVGLVGLLVILALFGALFVNSKPLPGPMLGPSSRSVPVESRLVSLELVSPSDLGSDPDGQGLIDALAKTAKAVGLTNVQSGAITSTGNDADLEVSLRMQGDPALLKPWLGAIEACTAPPMQVVSFQQPEAGDQGTATLAVTVRLDAERLLLPAAEPEKQR